MSGVGEGREQYRDDLRATFQRAYWRGYYGSRFGLSPEDADISARARVILEVLPASDDLAGGDARLYLAQRARMGEMAGPAMTARQRLRRLEALWAAPESVEPARNLDVVRVVLRYREAVAQATEQAYVELRALGIQDPTRHILGR